MNDCILSTRNLGYQVDTAQGQLRILSNINLDIRRGESVAIIGASGSGKSTLLSIIAGLDSPTDGQAFIDHHEISKLNEDARATIRQQYVAFVFQNFQLLSGLNATENVALPLEVRGDKHARTKALGYLERVGLSEREQHMPKHLSGGEQQRVALARAFACEAPIIFADEPTGNLDSETGDKVTELLFQLNKENQTTLILVTHSPTLASRCDRVLAIHSGSLIEQ